MSKVFKSIAKGVKKVFKGVVKVAKKIAPVALPIAATVLTAGIAGAAFPALGSLFGGASGLLGAGGAAGGVFSAASGLAAGAGTGMASAAGTTAIGGMASMLSAPAMIAPATSSAAAGGLFASLGLTGKDVLSGVMKGVEVYGANKQAEEEQKYREKIDREKLDIQWAEVRGRYGESAGGPPGSAGASTDSAVLPPQDIASNTAPAPGGPANQVKPMVVPVPSQEEIVRGGLLNQYANQNPYAKQSNRYVRYA